MFAEVFTLVMPLGLSEALCVEEVKEERLEKVLKMQQGWGTRGPAPRPHQHCTLSLCHAKAESEGAMLVAPRGSGDCRGGDAQQPCHQKGSSSQSWRESHLMPPKQALSNNHPSHP